MGAIDEELEKSVEILGGYTGQQMTGSPILQRIKEMNTLLSDIGGGVTTPIEFQDWTMTMPTAPGETVGDFWYKGEPFVAEGIYIWDGIQWIEVLYGAPIDLSAYATTQYVNDGLANKLDKTGGEVTGPLTITHSTRIRGSGTGSANTALLEFMESDNVTRKAYIGDYSGSNDMFVITSERGDLNLTATTGNRVLVKGYEAWHAGNLVNATTTTAGLMSASDKAKLDGLTFNTVNTLEQLSELGDVITILQAEIAELKAKVGE